jgi:Flp pilus assembly pilin Flp
MTLPRIRRIVRPRLMLEDSGQDLIEYALLSGLIGVVCVLAWTNIPPAIGAAYMAWDTNVQSLSSCTPDPGGGGC